MTEKKIKGDNIQNLLDAMGCALPGKGDNWPLSGGQILPYFDVDQSLDIYKRVNKLLSQGFELKEIGKLFKRPTMLRYFLNENGIVGLKVASKLGIEKIPILERVKYVDNLAEILKTMVISDPFCLDNKNLILNEKEIEKLKSEIYWFDINKENKRLFLELGVDLFAFSWAFYYNLFAGAGFEIHGPYEYVEHGEKYKLVIRDNFDMNPKDLWGFDTGIPPIKLYLLYRSNVDFRLSFTNQPVSEEHNEDLVRAAVCFGDKFITNPEIVKDLTQKIVGLTSIMTKKVNSLTPTDQVRKGADISFYMLKGIYDYMGDDWKADRFVEPLIEKVGTKFIEDNKDSAKNRSASDWIKIFDPGDDYLGDIIL